MKFFSNLKSVSHGEVAGYSDQTDTDEEDPIEGDHRHEVGDDAAAVLVKEAPDDGHEDPENSGKEDETRTPDPGGLLDEDVAERSADGTPHGQRDPCVVARCELRKCIKIDSHNQLYSKFFEDKGSFIGEPP